MLAASGHPMAAACLAGFASSLAAEQMQKA
jgi:hypothetical protein